MRIIELSLVPKILNLPLSLAPISAGFPSPADDYLDKCLDLNEYLVKKPAATFLVRVSGDSMIDAGIHDGDILIVDRSIKPQFGFIVIAVVNDEFTVKRFIQIGGKPYLKPENKRLKLIDISLIENFEISGVVVHAIKHFPK
jgi:DNA polymerase V